MGGILDDGQQYTIFPVGKLLKLEYIVFKGAQYEFSMFEYVLIQFAFSES